MPQRKLGRPLATELNMLFTCVSSTGSNRKVPNTNPNPSSFVGNTLIDVLNRRKNEF